MEQLLKLSLAALIAMVFSAPPVRACERINAAEPWVAIAINANSLNEQQREAVVRHMEVELALRSIHLCLAGATQAEHPPLAKIEIQSDPRVGVRVQIEIQDEVTVKRVARVLELGEVPKPGRPLAIAISAAELLRASWAELSLEQAARKPKRVEQPVERELKEVAEPAPADPIVEVALALGLQVFGGEYAQFGPRLSAGWLVTPSLRLAATLGIAQGTEHESQHGSVSGEAVQVACELGYRYLFGGDALSIELATGLEAARVAFLPDARPGDVALPYVTTISLAQLSAGVGYAWSSDWRVTLVGRGGWVLHGARAMDEGETVFALAGAIVGAASGVSLRF